MLIAALLCATPVLAQETKEPPPAENQLSQEDEELVKELALLERMELVKNLELFEPDKDEEPKPPPQGQP